MKKHEIKNYGFSPELTLQSITPEDYVFGDGSLEKRFSGLEIIRPDGKWDDFLPKKEIQAFGWGDTYHCTVFGTENVIQTLQIAKYGIKEEYTERFLGVLAGIKNGSGGSPHTVFEKWRSNGNLPYEHLPFEGVNSWEEFNSPNPMIQKYLDIAKKWLTDWRMGHDWIWDFRPENIIEALKYSPLGVGVYAWYEKDGVFINPGVPDNHWVEMFSYVFGKYWLVYDHYDNIIKRLDWNYPFKFMKRATLERITPLINESPQPKAEEGENMTFYQEEGSPKIYLRGADGLYHWIPEEPTFKALFGSFSSVKIEKLGKLNPEFIGFTIYNKQSFLTAITELLKTLGGRK